MQQPHSPSGKAEKPRPPGAAPCHWTSGTIPSAVTLSCGAKLAGPSEDAHCSSSRNPGACPPSPPSPGTPRVHHATFLTTPRVPPVVLARLILVAAHAPPRLSLWKRHRRDTSPPPGTTHTLCPPLSLNLSSSMASRPHYGLSAGLSILSPARPQLLLDCA